MTIYAAVLPRTPRLRNTRAPLPMQALTALAPLVAFFATYRLRASPAEWQRLNLSSGVLYALLGALNLVVAYNASERAWVNFKMFGLTLLTFAGITLQLLWLARARIAAGAGAGERG